MVGMNYKVLSVVFCFLIFMPLSALAGEYDTNSIFFEHWRHYESQGIACDYCHKSSAAGVYTLPDHKTCQFCHTPDKTKDYETSGKPVCSKCHPKNSLEVVTRLRLLPRTGKRFFFHSEQTEYICHVCHGKMLEDLIPMGSMRTSQKERIRIRQRSHYFYSSKACNNCHRNITPEDAPENHAMDWGRKHQEIAPQFNCRICHQKVFCQNCHENTY